MWQLQVTKKKIYTRNTGLFNIFRVKLSLSNLGFPYTFLESLIITEHCHVVRFLVTFWSLPELAFRHAVIKAMCTGRDRQWNLVNNISI